MKQSLGSVLLSICAVLLLLSSLEHLSNPFRFLDGVMAYQLVSFPVAQGVSALLPAVSLVAGLSLLTATLRPGGLALTAVLGLLFTAVQTTALVRDLTISCGCFDPFRSETISVASLLFPVTLMCIAVGTLILEGRHAKRHV